MTSRDSSTVPTVELLQTVDRYWQTVRHLRPRQVAARLSLRARSRARMANPPLTRRLYASRAARAGLACEADPWRLRGAARAVSPWISPDHARTIEQQSVDARRGVHTFLNDRRELGVPVDWSAPGASQLWRYHLHYFDWLPDFIAIGAAPIAYAQVTDWIARVPLAGATIRDAWHPYVVSVRLVNWMLAFAAAPPDLNWPDTVVDSLRVQTLFVRNNVETDVGGNHLLKNLKALAIAGCFWRGPGAQSLKERFVRAFVLALESQLRSDGGHYEQSPGYHAQVLGDAIDLAFVLRHADGPSSALETIIGRMEAFLAAVCHPDGELAQFGDTAAGLAAEPRILGAAAAVLRGGVPETAVTPRHALLASTWMHTLGRTQSGQAGCTSEAARLLEPRAPWDPRSSGFVTLTTGDRRGFLIADAGPVCPDELPAHAHSDLFGVEVSVDGLRVVVDSGVSEYAAGPWRDYFRSTRAHNTVMVDGSEQSDCWGSFRVGRRARVVDAQVEGGPGLLGFSAAHTGFDRLKPPVRHLRRVLLVAQRFWLLIDQLNGTGRHTWTTFLHLHPDVEVQAAMHTGLRARRGTASLGIAWFGIGAPHSVSGQRDPLQGWHAPAFGRTLPSPTLVAEGVGQLPARFGWLLVPLLTPDETFRLSEELPDRLVLQVDRETYPVSLQTPGAITDPRLQSEPDAAAP